MRTLAQRLYHEVGPVQRRQSDRFKLFKDFEEAYDWLFDDPTD